MDTFHQKAVRVVEDKPRLVEAKLRLVAESAAQAIEALLPAVRERHFVVGQGNTNGKGDLYMLIIQAEDALKVLQERAAGLLP